MGKRGTIKILPEAELEKLTTPRLLAIRKRLTPILGSMQNWCAKVWNEPNPSDQQYFAELVSFDEVLHRVMAKREHVVRKVKR